MSIFLPPLARPCRRAAPPWPRCEGQGRWWGLGGAGSFASVDDHSPEISTARRATRAGLGTSQCPVAAGSADAGTTKPPPKVKRKKKKGKRDEPMGDEAPVPSHLPASAADADEEMGRDEGEADDTVPITPATYNPADAVIRAMERWQSTLHYQRANPQEQARLMQEFVATEVPKIPGAKAILDS